MRKIVTECLALACVLLVFSSFSGAAEKPIKILALYPISGPVKSTAEDWLNGMRLAVEEINAEGGMIGRKVELTVEDSQLKPDVAVTKAQKYIIQGNVDILAGTVSSIVKPLQDLTKQHNVLFVMFSGADDETGKSFTYNSVRPWFSTSMAARALVTYVAKYTKFRKFYLLNQDYSYGREFAGAAKREIMRQIPGATIISEDYHPFSSKDLSPFLTKIKASGAEVIFTADWGLDMSVLVKQRHELGVKAVIVSPAVGNLKVIRENREAVKGSIACDTFFSTATTKEAVAFIDRWKKRYNGAVPSSEGTREYMGMQFLFEAVRKAGSVEVNKIMPVLEGMRHNTLNGEGYLRACDHQLHYPLQIVEIVSKEPPYVSVPTMMSVTDITIEEEAIDNPRCKRK